MVFGPLHSRVLSGRELLSDADPFHLLLLTFMRLFPILSPPHLDAIALPQSPYHALKRRGLRRAKALKVKVEDINRSVTTNELRLCHPLTGEGNKFFC